MPVQVIYMFNLDVSYNREVNHLSASYIVSLSDRILNQGTFVPSCIWYRYMLLQRMNPIIEDDVKWVRILLILSIYYEVFYGCMLNYFGEITVTHMRFKTSLHWYCVSLVFGRMYRKDTRIVYLKSLHTLWLYICRLKSPTINKRTWTRTAEGF